MNRFIFLILLILTITNCSDSKINHVTNEELTAMRTQLDSLKKLNSGSPEDTKGQLATFLTFQENNAEEAMNFYVSLFENSKIIDVQKYGKDGPAKEGTIMVATFELNGSKFMCSDSYIKHEWDFTPGVSNWVECKSDNEIVTLSEKLSENGNILMPLGNYGFSTKFTFIEDQFGVSWQLNLQ